MSRANKFTSTVVYNLKRRYGQSVTLYKINSTAMNVETGAVTISETATVINKAPVLEGKALRDFVYDISFIAENKNFTYGGLFDKVTKGILVDQKDLPSAYTLNLNDRFIVNGRRFQIKEFSELSELRATIFIVVELKGQEVGA